MIYIRLLLGGDVSITATMQSLRTLRVVFYDLLFEILTPYMTCIRSVGLT